MESTQNLIDVTVLPPHLKHATIFSKIDELQPGQSLTIHNDHDPKPLYYHLQSMYGDTFGWEYLEQGPEWWKVKISKK